LVCCFGLGIAIAMLTVRRGGIALAANAMWRIFSNFLVKKSKKCQKTAILGQKTIKNDISDLATRKFEILSVVVLRHDVC